jgi:hypothetical protein
MKSSKTRLSAPVGGAFHLIARPLVVDGALLINQLPPGPAQRRGDDDGRRHECREQ